MKICIISSIYEPYVRGGAEVVVERTVSGLQNSGQDVVLITLGQKNGIQRSGRLTIYRIKPFNIFSFLEINKYPFWFRLLWHPLDIFNVFGARLVKKILLKEKPDAVMTHNLKGIGY